MAVDFRVNLVAVKKWARNMRYGSGQGRAIARRSAPLMRLIGQHNKCWSQSPFVTMTSKNGSTPNSAAIFQRIYAAANTCIIEIGAMFNPSLRSIVSHVLLNQLDSSYQGKDLNERIYIQ